MTDEDEREEDYPPPVYDRGGLYVKAEQCSTCIFRPGNLMSLNAGRMRDLTEGCDRNDTNVICHQTLDQPVGAFCKGSVDRRAGQVVRIAQRIGHLRLV